MSDRFLGAWDVEEWVFAPDTQFIGTVKQKRRLYTDGEATIVDQHCVPSAPLEDHAMGRFSGSFRFRLEKRGRERRYLGPDVQGFGLNFGDRYLAGEGVWPRFGYNFRSWSISLSETRQLTGGVFFRGATIEAIIFGLGTLEGAARPDTVPLETRLRAGQGQSAALDRLWDAETREVCERRLLSAESWQETIAGHTQEFAREGTRFRCPGMVGTAMAYGPLLYWETHGTAADSIRGIEVADPFGLQQFSIRQHIRGGQLIRIEGLQFREEELA